MWGGVRCEDDWLMAGRFGDSAISRLWARVIWGPGDWRVRGSGVGYIASQAGNSWSLPGKYPDLTKLSQPIIKTHTGHSYTTVTATNNAQCPPVSTIATIAIASTVHSVEDNIELFRNIFLEKTRPRAPLKIRGAGGGWWRGEGWLIMIVYTTSWEIT